MSTNSASGRATTASLGLSGEWNLAESLRDTAKVVLTPLASLKLTVVLFAMSIFIIWVGTLAQVEQDMWEVIDRYFRSVIAWIEFRIFFPKSWFPTFSESIPKGYGFWFPGGFAVGVAMAANLVAAHLIRFKIQARGVSLWAGAATIVAGLILTWLVIDSGHNREGVQGVPIVSWSTLWLIFKGGLALLAVIAGLVLAIGNPSRGLERLSLLASSVVFGSLAIWLFAKGESMAPSASSLRILWQLILAVVPGLILLAGCGLVFRKRAGIVVLHTGIGLMMFSEFFVSKYAVEGRMTIREGETINYVQDIRTVELAVVDPSDEESDEVVAVPRELLRPGETIRHEFLPFDIQVEKYFKNAVLRPAKTGESVWATAGAGKRFVAEEARAASGTDSDGQVDMAAVRIELFRKGTDESLGKYLLSQLLSDSRMIGELKDHAETVRVEDKTYDVYLRFKRTYTDYSLALKDVRKDDYLGTSTPMNYSSDVRLVDNSQEFESDFKIWMNNPLRYAGETFYQSNYSMDRDGVEVTGLQVVTNTGWMMPYVGCMFVVVGMLAHFGLTLDRFLNRLNASSTKNKTLSATTSDADDQQANGGHAQTSLLLNWGVPALIVLLCAGWVGSKLRPPTETKSGMKLHEFGQIPVIYKGRVKPLDTLARNSLRAISNRETFKDANGNKQPAIRWLADVISGSKDAIEHPVFRIENLDVLETLGLERRKRFRYALSELSEDKLAEFNRQVDEARKQDVSEVSVYQKKLIELDRRFRTFTLLQGSFEKLPFPPAPTLQEIRADPDKMIEKLGPYFQEASARDAALKRMEAPLAVPMNGEDEWLPFTTAWNKAYFGSIRQLEPPPETAAWNTMLTAYAGGDTKAFNEAVSEYRNSLADEPPAELQQARLPLETFFNYFAPFYHASVLYVAAFVLVIFSWLLGRGGLSKPLNQAAFWLIVFTLCVHTFALGARISISGRPPVTNLYSSAVFIGWAAVVFGIVLEWLYRLGIGNLIAAVSGFATLLIAHFLALDGDTFTVLQAVLDTQFWLATHVVCVTLGYAATFVAGLLGAMYILMRAGKRPELGRELTRMTYGTLCFAIFFSFFGTVLGGLWADDSWGRFWGWDPKENGALIIVLWNALILHARWGGMIKQRGLAVLAVAGNITTSWSWFGVNELGVGLHSYGFTEGVLLALGLFVLSQLLIVGLAFVPSFTRPAT